MSQDFSVAHYLGMQHSSRELPGWDVLTTGVPAAFFEACEASNLGKSIANLQGLADGITAPSTLHLFWDWFGGLDHRYMIFADNQLYKVGAAGVERARGKGINILSFNHLCADSLQITIKRFLKPGKIPVVVTDGLCPFCGKTAALKDYLKILNEYNGMLVVDDTQALGIIGSNPSQEIPYGYGGGGSLKYLNAVSNRVIVIASLAKAFGAPLAVLSGSVSGVSTFKRHSETRIHSSPPSVAALLSGQNAVRLNQTSGNFRRRKLYENVVFFKKIMSKNGIHTSGGILPVQTISCVSRQQAGKFYHTLLKRGIRIVPVMAHDKQSGLCWLISSRHEKSDIYSACHTFFECVKNPSILNNGNHEYFARRNYIV